MIPGYTIVQELQQGTRSIIYRARRVRDMQPVILKVSHGAGPLSEAWARLRHEYEIVRGLNCPGVVQPYSLEHDGQRGALVLEDFGGISLRELLAGGPLEVGHVLPIALQLATTLEQIHQQQIVHRDLKPANILYNAATQQVKIADFGSAARLGSDNLLPNDPQQIEGTFDYMAPEQTGRLNRSLDYRADFYALGVTLYEVLSGRLPFQASDPLELMHAHIARQPVPLLEHNPQIPAALAAIVARLMAKAPEERYQSASGLRADLERCLAEWEAHGSIAAFVPGVQCYSALPESTGHTSTSTDSSAFDLTTVVKAAQALSSEIVLDTLLEKMMCIVLESAGAQRGFILLESEGQLIIEAVGSVADEPDTTVLKSVPLDACTELAQSVVNYVRRTGESLVIEDATQDSRFAHDPYVARQSPRSLLCIPVSSRGGLRGILYLENNLMVAAFTPDRSEMIQMLVSHAAISLENARLYHEMKNEIGERRRAEEALRSITEGTASVTGGDFFRSLVRYLAAAFEVRYAFVAECIDASLTQVRTLALLGGGEFQENIEYDVRGTPCDKVIGGQVCYYPSRLQELFPVHGNHESYLGSPLHDSAGAILGHLAVMDDEPMYRSPYDMSIMRIFAARAGAELERKRTEEALRQSEEELRELNEQLADYSRNLERKVAERTHEIEQRRQVAERLRDMLAILNSNRSLSEILDYVVEQADGLLGTRSSAIYRLQPEQEMFILQAARGLPTAYTSGLSFPLARSFLGRAVLSRRPILIHDLAASLQRYDVELSEDRRVLLATYHSLLAVPLIRQGESEETNEIYGGIAFYYSEPRQVSEEEIGLAVAFADQAALAIENARLREQVEQAAVTEERGRLARELHDSVTQSLYSLTLLAEGWRRLAASGRMDDLADPLAELGGIAQQALKEMRLLVHELRPPALEREGLLGALHERLAAVERRAGVDARLLADDVVELPAHVEEGLYRIAQEALNNALKHAAATTVSVRLSANAEHIELIVTDDGQGFEPHNLTDQGGIGLSSMRERTERLGGTLELASAPGAGTRVYVRLMA
jgi:signal transduction histidine kinase/serine/threonine protein kinase